MAGNEENTTLLEGINQTIKAINDLATALAAIALNPTINNTCTPQVVATPVVQINPIGGGVAPTPVSSVGTQGGDPPSGFIPPNQQTPNRKCKASNAIFSAARATVQELQDLGVQNAPAIGSVAVAGAITVAFAAALPPFGALIGAVVGVVAGVVTYMVSGQVNLAHMLDSLDEHQDEIICGLYLEDNAGNARDDVIAIVTGDDSMNFYEGALLGLILNNNLLNLLFFSSTPEIEAAIDAADILKACGGCNGGEGNWVIGQGSGEIVYNEPFEVEGALDELGHYGINLYATCDYWPTNDTVTILGDDRGSPAGFLMKAFDPNGGPCALMPGDAYNTNGNVPENTQYDCAFISGVDIAGPWTLTLQIDESA
jgi:hypothetical protein